MQNKKKKIEQILINTLSEISEIANITNGEASLEFTKRYIEMYDSIEYLLEDIKNNQIKVFGKETLGKAKDTFKIK